MLARPDNLSVVSWGRSSVVSTGRGSGVLGLSGVSHISNIAVIVVGVVGDSLGPAIGKSNGVGSSNNTVAVIVLLLVESSLGVVISHSVGELVGRHLSKVGSSISGLHGGVVSGSMVDSVNSVGNNTVSTVESVGGISND